MDNTHNHTENDNDTLLNDDDHFHVYSMLDIYIKRNKIKTSSIERQNEAFQQIKI